jgi:hypothetical protein
MDEKGKWRGAFSPFENPKNHSELHPAVVYGILLQSKKQFYQLWKSQKSSLI